GGPKLGPVAGLGALPVKERQHGVVPESSLTISTTDVKRRNAQASGPPNEAPKQREADEVLLVVRDVAVIDVPLAVPKQEGGDALKGVGGLVLKVEGDDQQVFVGAT